MKLNYRNTFYVGLIFFIISLFWQTYDMLIARTLIDKFGLNQTWSGIVMAFDNIMAVILLPLFGALSDKSNSKRGRRTPYIVVGTVLSAFAFMALAYTDQVQTLKIQATDIVENHYDIAFNDLADVRASEHWLTVVDNMTLEREESFNLGKISGVELSLWEDEIQIPMLEVISDHPTELTNRELSIIRDLYYNYLSNRAWEVTSNNLGNLFVFVGILFVALVSMAIYRSPAVALMPDVTIKPLRSKANAIITLMGTLGGVLSIYIINLSGIDTHSYDYHGSVYFMIAIIMILVLGIFLWKVREPKLVKEKQDIEKQLQIFSQDNDGQKNGIAQMTRKRRISLYLMLTSVFLLFAGYNAVMSKISDYLPKVLNLNFFDFPFIIAQVFIVLIILPIGILSMILGRKRTVLLGMFILIIAMGSVYFLQENEAWKTAGIIGIAGIGWTMIGINTYVMVVELSKGNDVGRYTGYYYAASMSAQIFTPIFSGILMDNYGRLILFPYATIFITLSLFTMIFVRLGDTTKVKKSWLQAYREMKEKL